MSKELGWNQQLAREGGVFLMDRISKVIRRTEVLDKLNNVRLYLKDSRLSDIVTDDGQWLHNLALHGPPLTSALTWPKRRKPLKKI